MTIVPQIRIERRLNFCVSQNATTVQRVIQTSMYTLLSIASGLVTPGFHEQSGACR